MNILKICVIIAQVALFLGFILFIMSSIIPSDNFNLSMVGHSLVASGILILACTLCLINSLTITLSTKIANILPFVIFAIPIIILLTVTNIKHKAFNAKLVPDVYYEYYNYL